ncbi:P antigen family member 1-like [Muntiacus reevesi]|uniref:P antigen family member 1-like n=1 Tax=Muntiacus reevesi TaxID=9886 RepID=UPI0033074501
MSVRASQQVSGELGSVVGAIALVLVAGECGWLVDEVSESGEGGIEVEEPEEESTIERKNIPPRQERQDEGASAFPGPALEVQGPALEVQGPALEADQQELAEPEPKTGGEHGDGPEPEPKTGSEHGDGPGVEGEGLPDPEPMKMPEAGI